MPLCTFLGRLFGADLTKPVSNVHPSVRPSVHKRIYSISMKIGLKVEVDEWCTTVCSMTPSKIKVKVTSFWQLEILPFSKASPPPFTMCAGNWPRILKLGHNIYIWFVRIFYICSVFCVSRDWTWQKRQLWRVDRQSRMGLIYYSSFQTPGINLVTEILLKNLRSISVR